MKFWSGRGTFSYKAVGRKAGRPNAREHDLSIRKSSQNRQAVAADVQELDG
jgi:hypothetical protein